jgi:hypothetical protein
MKASGSPALMGRLVPSSCGVVALRRSPKLGERSRNCHGVALAKTEADAGTQFTIYDSSAPQKQLLIFKNQLEAIRELRHIKVEVNAARVK